MGPLRFLSSSVLDIFRDQSVRSLLWKEFPDHHSLSKLFVVNLVCYSDIYPSSLFTLVLQISELIIHTKLCGKRIRVITQQSSIRKHKNFSTKTSCVLQFLMISIKLYLCVQKNGYDIYRFPLSKRKTRKKCQS